jgi:hypothetical protein
MPTKVIPIPIEVWKKAKNIDEIDKWVKNNYPELIVKHKPMRKRDTIIDRLHLFWRPASKNQA